MGGLKRLLFLTGEPSVGKTTVFLKALEDLQVLGYSVGGMVSREVRSCGERVGFEIVDLADGIRGWLSHINQRAGPQVGRYRVNLEDLERIGVAAIEKANEHYDVTAIDEVGPMEFCSTKFIQSVRDVVLGSKLVIGTIHMRAKHELASAIRARNDAGIFAVTLGNREHLHETVVKEAVAFLSAKRLE